MSEPNEPIGYFADSHVGVTYEGVKFEQRTQPDGVTKYWRASQAIGSLFGSEVEGECEGFGPTKEKALERLAEDKEKLQESMWI
jgi:hypothetical protein